MNRIAEQRLESDVTGACPKDRGQLRIHTKEWGWFLSPLWLRRVWSIRERPRIVQPWLDSTAVLVWLCLAFLPWQSWYGGKVRLGEALQGVSAAHPLGTDSMGRDMLVRLSGAIQTGVLPLWLAVAMGVICGGLLAIGCLAVGRYSRLKGAMKLVDLAAVSLATVPAGVMAFAWGAVRERVDLLGVMSTLGILFAVRMYLLVRDLDRRDQKLGYWTAHEALGGTALSRIWHYGIRGGWSGELMESLWLNLRVAVAIEAAVSYLGFGVAEPAPSFGNMLATHFDYYLKGHVGVVIPIILGLALTAMVPGAFVRMCRRVGGTFT